ncbi:MAG: NYN domain-containing protein [Calditrichaeota bacterium]|nr:NYN domain-containing protein [Calditrichota bacterium]
MTAKKTDRPLRVSIFVDGANMFYTQKRGLGWFFDPAKLLKTLKGEDELADAFWYMGVKSTPESRDENFLRFLAYAGYTVRTKQLKTIFDSETGETIQKANLDIEIAMDMFNTVENYDKAILLSGDGDFERALELLRSRGKRICVVSTHNWIATELRMAVGSHYIDLQDLRPLIERTERGRESGADQPGAPFSNGV